MPINNNTPPPHVFSSFQWRIGLINCGNKYLTAERFGFKINATGNSLRKYQIWLIEPDPHDEDGVYLKSNMGRWVTWQTGIDTSHGVVTGADSAFHIENVSMNDLLVTVVVKLNTMCRFGSLHLEWIWRIQFHKSFRASMRVSERMSVVKRESKVSRANEWAVWESKQASNVSHSSMSYTLYP